MKRKLIYFFSVLAIIACTNEDLPDFTAHEEYSKNAIDSFYVPYETALQHALKVLNHDSTATRASGTERKVSNHYEYVANKATRSNGDGDTEVRFHVINFEDNLGFALVSADSRTTPVYAYSETGNLDIEAATNSGFGDFMAAAEIYYLNEINLEIPMLPELPNDSSPFLPKPTEPIHNLPIVELDGKRYYLGGGDIIYRNPDGILLNVEWDQGWPYNYYCGLNDNAYSSCNGRNAAGCGPIAAAQIMSYFKYPTSFAGFTFDWDRITSYTYFYNLTNEAESAARLINLIGIESNATYGRDTSTRINNMDDMFITFGYSCTGPINYNVAKAKESLNNSSPIYFRGSDSKSGHAWVIDAYRQTDSYYIYYQMDEPYNVYRTITDIGDTYYHCNWGWSGSYNGWYLDVFKLPDNTNLSSGRQMIYNITPNNI